jgi:hypothetical protein
MRQPERERWRRGRDGETKKRGRRGKGGWRETHEVKQDRLGLLLM